MFMFLNITCPATCTHIVYVPRRQSSRMKKSLHYTEQRNAPLLIYLPRVAHCMSAYAVYHVPALYGLSFCAKRTTKCNVNNTGHINNKIGISNKTFYNDFIRLSICMLCSLIFTCSIQRLQ